MSFILDALRKSETERQRQTTPGIIDTRHAGRRPARNIWLPVLTLVLAINAALAGYWLLTRIDGKNTIASPSSGSAPQTQPAPSADSKPRVRPLATELKPAADTPEPETAAVPDTTPVASGGTSSAAAPATLPSSSTKNGPELLPSMQQLILAGVVTLPPLHLDIHVYSEQPQQRFVFVNMRKYHEGEQLKEGPLLESITADGIILNQDGNRFTLNRE